jgi:serralysin
MQTQHEPGEQRKPFRTLGQQVDVPAKPLLSGDQAFTLLATAETAFTGTAGQLRWFKEDVARTANDNTIILGDINGDKIVDFQIEIDGLFNLAVSDFVL